MNKNDVVINAKEMDLKPLVVSSGVYFLYNNDELVYIGKAQNIAKRILEHIVEGTKPFNRVMYELVPVDSLSRVETILIKALKPPFNKSQNNDIEHSNYIPSRSSVSIRPIAMEHHLKRDGTMNVKIRFTYKRRSFYVKTNFFVYQEDIDAGNIINPKVKKDIDVIISKYRNITKYISFDKSFEYVQNKILAANI
jgi:hypothetical protein